MSTFCLLYGGLVANAKERLRNGESVDQVLDELYLLTFSELCCTLTHPEAALMHGLNMYNQTVNNGTANVDEDEDEYDAENEGGDEYDGFYDGPAFYPSKKMKLSSSFECTWPDCRFKSAYSSSVGEHIGKLHMKCQTRGPNKDDYLDEAKKYIRKVDDAGEQSTSTVQQNDSSSGPFFCCDRTFKNLYNLNLHQNSRRCAMFLKDPEELKKEQEAFFAAEAAAAVAAFSRQSKFTENDAADDDFDDAIMMVKTEFKDDDSDKDSDD